MKTETRLKILDAMTNPLNNGKTQKELAKQVGVAVRTFRNYLTNDMWNEINKLRLNIVKHQLDRVDQAVYEKAIQGDMSAARLLYGRWQSLKEHQKEQATKRDIETKEVLKEADDEIKRLRAEISRIEKQYPLN